MGRFRILGLVLAMVFVAGSPIVVWAQNASEVKEELDAYKDDVNAGIGTLSSRIAALESAGKLKFKGDLRARYEYFTQAQDNSRAPGVAMSSNKNIPNRGRWRVRLRFGAEKAFGDEVFVAFRLATGSSTEATSTNQTLGSQNVLKGIFLDQAYLRYTPSFLGSKLDLYAGKMVNLLDVTPITWDGDVTPEGLGVVLRAPMRFTLKGHAMVLAESSSLRDPYLTNLQLTRDFKLAGNDLHLMAGYQFVPWVMSMSGVAGWTPTATNNSPISMESAGMLVNAENGRVNNLKVIEGMMQYGHKLAGVPFKWTFHVARNTDSFALNRATTANKVTAGNQRNANAYFVKCEAGNSKAKGDLKAALQWGYIEPNAVLGLFSDSDSGTGFNNQKWLKADLGLMLTDDLSLNLGQYRAKRVNYEVTQGTSISNKNEVSSRAPLYRTQADLVVKF
jgi:hypothetical protein